MKTASSSLFFFNDTATTEIYTLSLHDALPIFGVGDTGEAAYSTFFTVPGATEVARLVFTYAWHLARAHGAAARLRSEEHTSELQSPCNLVCRLLLEKKKQGKQYIRL